ncbi:hypothetical protein HK097_000636, partial [Rhizophlyctis rosea]
MQVLYDFPIYITPSQEHPLIDLGGETEPKEKRMPDAFLSVRVHVSDSQVLKIEKKIQLPTPLDEMNIFQMPDFPLDQDIFEFINDVETNLKAAHMVLLKGKEKRKEMIGVLLETFSRQVLEYDDEEFRYASFLFEVAPRHNAYSPPPTSTSARNNVSAVANVHLDLAYPTVPPAVFLFSNDKYESPHSYKPLAVHMDFRVSAQWDCRETVARL